MRAISFNCFTTVWPIPTEIDSPWGERLERAKRLDDVQRRVVRHHDPAGAEPDPGRYGGGMRDQDLGRRGRDVCAGSRR